MQKLAVKKSLQVNGSIQYPPPERVQKKGFWDRAIEDFTEAISLNPSNINAYKQRAIAYEKKGLTEAAKEDLKKVMQLGVESGGKGSF